MHYSKLSCLFALLILDILVTNGLPVCPFDALPLRNSTTGDLVLCDDIEIFCPLKNSQCILDEGKNASVAGVCCPKVAAMQPRAGEGCPKGATPMRNTYGQLVTCTTSVVNSCPALERVQCQNGPFGSICCIADSVFCPTGYDPYYYPGTMLPLVCPSMSTCPYGYQCMKSPDAGGPYACCRPKQYPPQCPNGFQPYSRPDGSPATCIVGNPVSCPPPSVCIQSSNPFQNYCCLQSSRPTTLQCPNGYDTPVSGLLVACILDGINRCPFGASCKPSVGSPGGVCCRSLARCPTGYTETMNQATQEIVECSSSALLPPTCPTGSTCLLSSTTVSSLCCTSVSQCPSGYDPVQPIVQCQVDSQCPVGAQCIQRVCCRSTVTVRAQCPNGYITSMDPNNNPVICTATQRWCPGQATCMQSATSSDLVCCTPNSPGWPQCPAGMSITFYSGQPIPCDPANINSCPQGSTCQTSLIPSTPARICCQSSPVVQPQCPIDMSIVYSGGQPIPCDSLGSTCPSGSTCQPSSTPSTLSRICCQPNSTPQPQCPTGMSMTLFGGQPIPCDTSSVNICPAGSTCQTSLTLSIPARLCCQPDTTPQFQCPNGLILILGTDKKPIYCNPGVCPTAATCERAVNTGENVCCGVDRGNKCPSGYRAQVSGQSATCDPSATDPCSNGGFCLPSLSDQGELTTDTICCDAIGTQCPPGFNRPDGTGSTPNTCDPSSVDPCRSIGPGSMCIGGVGTAVGSPRPFLCCQRAALCIGGRIPYYDGTYVPKTCVINRPNECASVYRCELSSTVESESVCCPRPKPWK